MLNVILSKGRIGDRTKRTIEGAALTAEALKRHYRAKAQSFGVPHPPAKDDWSVSLPQARETLVELGKAIEACIKSGDFPIMVANTCSASLASLPIVAEKYPDAVVLWIDAHGDFNTPETTDTGYLGGMVLSAVCGLWESGHGAGVQPKQVILVGARDIDPAESELLRQAGVLVIPPAEATPEAIIDAVADAKIWVHIDWDALEPGFVPADYKVPHGLLPTQIGDILGAIPASQFLGIEVAEFHSSQDNNRNEEALAIILDTLAPLLGKVWSEPELPTIHH